MTDKQLTKLQNHAQNIRRNILTMVSEAGSGHVGGALGLADMLTYLYFEQMNVSPKTTEDEDRDRFVLSPAHMVPGLYATLIEASFLADELVHESRKFGSPLQGHAFRNLEIGVETTGGSLGQGLSIAIGYAHAARLRQKLKTKEPSYNTYCVISDGELNEGQTWEALMLAAREKFDNLFIILDRNNIQLSGNTEKLMPLEPIADKLRAFNLAVIEIDGNDFQQIAFAFDKARMSNHKTPIILSNTVAGNGVDFMENNAKWHGEAPDAKQLKQALAQLNNE